MSPSYSTHGGHAPSQACVSFSLRPAPWDKSKILVHPLGYPAEAPPMYSIMIDKDNAPNVVIVRGWGRGPMDLIGDARLPSLSSKIPLTFYGQSMIMHLSQMSGNCTLDSPTLGRLKWKANMLTGKKMELHDAAGHTLAKFRSGNQKGEKMLEIFMANDSPFFELVMLSGLTAKTAKSITEATGEMLGAILGA
ncbi:hypothetical protein N7457_001971 [Penicillium paradoxum]|uniref:uncharacterized protein n=1 Tax=Penicillium paradoxum TaxID=176176 RepID=UPI002547E192|nr:uncharacterized protein N7457_001971 [Penicillium paradoxum]KAJ5786981.1 hypothetical protein N7457_001971 [Penicillium paradoxum]